MPVTDVNPTEAGTNPGVGRVARVIGPVVDVEFPADQMPDIQNALKIKIDAGDLSREITAEVALHVGDNIVLRIASARTGYLYCYYQDAGGAVTQIYPNPQQTAPAVQGKTALLVPDISQADSFLIQAAKPGAEQAWCASTQQPLVGKVPEALTAAKLSPLADYADIGAVRQALEGSGLVVASQALSWQVNAPASAASSGAKGTRS